MVLKDLRLKLKVLANAIFGLVTIVKYGYVLLYKNKVRNCMMIIDEDWQNVVSPSDRNFMIDRVRFGKRLMVICAMFVYMSGVGVRMIMPLTAGKIVTSQNITIRPLPSAAYFVMFDVQRSPAYEIVFCLQLFAGIIKYTITVATFGLITFCVMHFCSQLDVLMTLMDSFTNERQFENLNRKLAIVVEHQIKTQNFRQLIQSIIQYPSLIEVLGSTLLMCLVGFYVIMVRK
ncbi:uncharacterized protein [Linepithema humile]|uniref:uncharacterized protein n=1 Tax=Linepithema humile TaxID=83485 RepID=UPI00351F03DE